MIFVWTTSPFWLNKRHMVRFKDVFFSKLCLKCYAHEGWKELSDLIQNNLMCSEDKWSCLEQHKSKSFSEFSLLDESFVMKPVTSDGLKPFWTVVTLRKFSCNPSLCYNHCCFLIKMTAVRKQKLRSDHMITLCWHYVSRSCN